MWTKQQLRMCINLQFIWICYKWINLCCLLKRYSSMCCRMFSLRFLLEWYYFLCKMPCWINSLLICNLIYCLCSRILLRSWRFMYFLPCWCISMLRSISSNIMFIWILFSFIIKYLYSLCCFSYFSLLNSMFNSWILYFWIYLCSVCIFFLCSL